MRRSVLGRHDPPHGCGDPGSPQTGGWLWRPLVNLWVPTTKAVVAGCDDQLHPGATTATARPHVSDDIRWCKHIVLRGRHNHVQFIVKRQSLCKASLAIHPSRTVLLITHCAPTHGPLCMHTSGVQARGISFNIHNLFGHAGGAGRL
jgi:hypothetical protein